MFSGPAANPCSETGRLQSDISRIDSAVKRKADDYKVSSLESRVDALVKAVSDITSACDAIVSRLQTCEENILQIQQQLNEKE